MLTDCVFLFGPRACGKSTVAAVMAQMLPGWTAVDIDYEYHLRHRGNNNGPAASGTGFFRPAGAGSEYYRECRRILLELIERERLIIALNGGALVNEVQPDVCAQNLQTCRNRGKLVLLLPSRWDFRNRRILFEREKKRYPITWERACRTYDRRVPLLRSYADCVVYGSPPERVARKIIRRFRLRGVGSQDKSAGNHLRTGA